MRQSTFCYVVLGAVLALSSVAPALGGYKKIVHPDGRVEFTDEGVSQKARNPSPVVNQKPAINRSAAAKSRSAYTTVYKYQQEDGVISFSDSQLASGIQLEVIKFDCFACSPASTVDWHSTPLNLSAYKEQIDAVAASYSLEPALVRAVIHAESGFNPRALSPQGAQGLMQLMPGTARELGVGDPFDTHDNIRGGSKYLAELLTLFNGDIRLATAAYNAGPNAVRKYGDIPPYDETRTYVERVGILHSRYLQAL